MPHFKHHKSAMKRIKQDKKKRARNFYFKKTLKTLEKSFVEAVDSGAKKNELEEKFNELISMYDRVAGKGIIHKNKAARKVSKYTKIYNNLK